jgi:hypothetical protein
MNQQPLVPGQSHPLRVYIEEEQRLRWALIIEAILQDSGPAPPAIAHLVSQQPASQPRQAA